MLQWDIFNNSLKVDNQYNMFFFSLTERLYTNKVQGLMHDSIRTIAEPARAVQCVAYGDSA